MSLLYEMPDCAFHPVISSGAELIFLLFYFCEPDPKFLNPIVEPNVETYLLILELRYH